ncbi:hypothetical protein CEXT_815571 [Caerostris extrusa]|uniref:Uncharacterized protein n=1 Tax=Caerostris extrusa TaxID=172846 RepID=A0AAV4S3U1_CAEEX|nr:hypothetical protein CEXT_815571 [Caerostris extrusa]
MAYKAFHATVISIQSQFLVFPQASNQNQSAPCSSGLSSLWHGTPGWLPKNLRLWTAYYSQTQILKTVVRWSLIVHMIRHLSFDKVGPLEFVIWSFDSLATQIRHLSFDSLATRFVIWSGLDKVGPPDSSFGPFDSRATRCSSFGHLTVGPPDLAVIWSFDSRPPDLRVIYHSTKSSGYSDLLRHFLSQLTIWPLDSSFGQFARSLRSRHLVI